MHTNQKMEAEIREISGVCSGTVRIGSTYSLLAGVFPTMLQRLQKDYPDIVCSIDDHNILVLEDMVQTGKLDFIISHLPPDGPNMQSKEVVTERLYLVFSKNYATQKNLLPQGKMEFSNVNWELLEKLPAYLTHEKNAGSANGERSLTSQRIIGDNRQSVVFLLFHFWPGPQRTRFYNCSIANL